MFKEAFKYYKSKNPPPDLTQVVDFYKSDQTTKRVRKSVRKDIGGVSKYGLNETTDWEVFELCDHPGLIFIKNPFTLTGQRYWTVRCLQDYTKKPNISNLDQFNVIPGCEDWWEYCLNNNDTLLLNKLRWVTLGYHHDWDTKIYSDDNKGEFPKDLTELTSLVAQSLGFSFKAEAAIVNFYHLDSTLSGHTDHSEQNLEAPLLSFSFGQTAIFLIGGKTKEDPATAMFLRSGDIVIMSKESRLCYHGVPRILKTDIISWSGPKIDNLNNCDFKDILNICQDEVLWKPFNDYLLNSRINVNVRQVLKTGETKLSSVNATSNK